MNLQENRNELSLFWGVIKFGQRNSMFLSNTAYLVVHDHHNLISEEHKRKDTGVPGRGEIRRMQVVNKKVSKGSHCQQKRGIINT